MIYICLVPFVYTVNYLFVTLGLYLFIYLFVFFYIYSHPLQPLMDVLGTSVMV